MRVYGEGPKHVLLIGDSVAFTVGVTQSESIAAVVAARTGATVLDASVVGYGLEDYALAYEHLMEVAKPDIVVVMLTLNDIQPSVQKQILSHKPSVGIARKLNDFLRPRSRTYLWIKGIFDNTAERHFRATRSSYEKAVPEQIEPALDKLASGAPTVFLLGPYRYEAK
ncbi:unnamed protein product, partial [Laminaria digitata]